VLSTLGGEAVIRSRDGRRIVTLMAVKKKDNFEKKYPLSCKKGKEISPMKPGYKEDGVKVSMQ